MALPNLERAAAHSHRGPSRAKALFHIPFQAADAKRSAKNIQQWNSYLPADCVRTMVRMGWDYTT